MNQVKGLPHFLLGQSMGGAVALKVHLKQPKEWDGVLLVAPMCKVSLLALQSFNLITLLSTVNLSALCVLNGLQYIN